MTLFWFGIGAGVAGVGLIVWTLARAAKLGDQWFDAFDPLDWPAHVRPPRRPFNWADDGDWWIKTLREEIAALPQTEER